MDESLAIINRTYEAYKGIIKVTYHMEKRWRFTLGASIEESVLALLRELIMAKHAPRPLKSAYLIQATGHLDMCALKLRLCLEVAVQNPTTIFQIHALLQDVGRQLGGWKRSLSS